MERYNDSRLAIQFIRHATLILEIADQKILIDPMLSPKETMDPVANAVNNFRIPMVDLPIDEATLSQWLNSLTAIVVTHTHRDHWDAKAIQILPKNLPLFCQPSDESVIKNQGFTDVRVIQGYVDWKGITITRTGGQHGTGEIGRKMGTVSGFIFQTDQAPALYVAGDTIWCNEVADALRRFLPKHVIVNAGAAQFLTGGPITMDTNDIAQVCKAMPEAEIIAVHMDTVNHCLLKRTDLKTFAEKEKLNIRIPLDGQKIEL
ncbi:MBL fold metallo-hydrolase [bacterium]|nr:MBL fold metallo-hydrolase [bacterium]